MPRRREGPQPGEEAPPPKTLYVYTGERDEYGLPFIVAVFDHYPDRMDLINAGLSPTEADNHPQVIPVEMGKAIDLRTGRFRGYEWEKK